MKTNDLHYNSQETTTLDESQNNGNKAKTSSKHGGSWKEVATGSGTGILFGAATTFFTSAADSENIPQHPLVDEHIPVATCVNDNMSFSQAFAAARVEVGPGGAFEWHGNLYNTYTIEEWSQMSDEERTDFGTHFAWTEGNTLNNKSFQGETDMADKSISVATSVNDGMSFSQAFAAARAEVGSGGVFEWHGNLYNTFTIEEWNHMSAEERSNFSSELNDSPFKPNHPYQPSNNRTHQANLQQDSHNDSQVEVIHYETVTNGDGSPMDVAIVNIEGQQAVIIDANRDGIADAMAMDLNQNNQLDEGEIINIETENIAMQPLRQEAQINENQPNVIAYETITTNDGNPIDVAVVDAGGQQIIFADYDRNGKADIMAMDVNQDGQLDMDEIIDISHENITMQDFQQANSMNQNSYLTMTNEGPDYLDEVNVDGCV